jgi:hypothetical protein
VALCIWHATIDERDEVERHLSAAIGACWRALRMSAGAILSSGSTMKEI